MIKESVKTFNVETEDYSTVAAKKNQTPKMRRISGWLREKVLYELCTRKRDSGIKNYQTPIQFHTNQDIMVLSRLQTVARNTVLDACDELLDLSASTQRASFSRNNNIHFLRNRTATYLTENQLLKLVARYQIACHIT